MFTLGLWAQGFIQKSPEPSPIVVALPPPADIQPQARIAIVLDDWGYNLKAMPWVKSMDEPLTLALLPHLAYSKRIAEKAHAYGHEILLHLPMEPTRNVPLEKGTL